MSHEEEDAKGEGKERQRLKKSKKWEEAKEKRRKYRSRQKLNKVLLKMTDDEDDAKGEDK